MTQNVPTKSELAQALSHLDGKGYRDYKQVKGLYHYENFQLQIDHVQGDPFAAMSQVRIFVENRVCEFDDWYFQKQSRLVALCDFLTREFHRVSKNQSKLRGSGNSGLISIDEPGQELLPRTALFFDQNAQRFEVRFLVGFPADGRKILGQVAAEIFRNDIPKIFEDSLLLRSLSESALRRHAETHEDVEVLRTQVDQSGLVAFVANDALLPRASGVDDRPLDSQESVPFKSPDSLAVSFDLPHSGRITGMGIGKGVTLVTGGGYHGKSTLLSALENGVYNHIAGDGREFVVATPDTVKIRAEDGRNVVGVDISGFINNLPNRKDTRFFSTNNASGSTSQATNIVEALQLGAKVLLIDEDTSATNFMMRDRRMQELVAKESEPITPLIDRIDSIVRDLGVSMVAVIGGAGDYLDHATTVIRMNEYCPEEVTEEAKKICDALPSTRLSESSGHESSTLQKFSPRKISPNSISPRQGKRERHIKIRGRDEILFGVNSIDLSLCEQVKHRSQLQAIAYAMTKLSKETQTVDIGEFCKFIESTIADHGLQSLIDSPEGNLIFFRRFELAQAINRCRSLKIK